MPYDAICPMKNPGMAGKTIGVSMTLQGSACHVAVTHTSAEKEHRFETTTAGRGDCTRIRTEEKNDRLTSVMFPMPISSAGTHVNHCSETCQ